jgi:hypothetical protein
MNQPSPLAKKLLMKSGQRWLVINQPETYLATLGQLPDGTQLSFIADGRFDGIHLFVKNSQELDTALAELKPILKENTILWIIYPKKNSGMETDLEMMSGWEVSKKYGLRPVASVAINNIWTTLRFRPEHLVKHSDFSEAAIKQNDYSLYIDTDKKHITLPQYLQEALSGQPAAFTTYDKLAWSHRKEYLVWILSAKQEKTRESRIAKMIEMLLAGKKNPSDK